MKVAFLRAAEHDLNELFAYIKNELKNEVAARNVATKLLQRAQMLASFPELGANLANADSKLGGYRYLLVDSYLVIYKIIDEAVCIVRILYARSDYIQLLQG